MASDSQRRAIQAHRRRLSERGLKRFEVRGLEADKELVRAIAQCLATNNGEASALRTELARHVGGGESPVGGILAALRRSPMVGADLDLTREETSGRDAGL